MVIGLGLTNAAMLFAGAAATSMALTYGVRNLARRRGWVHEPSGHHIHKLQIPRLGGVAIYTTFMTLFLACSAGHLIPNWRSLMWVLGPATLMFVIGLVDDFRGISARVKLGFQIIAGCWFCLATFGVIGVRSAASTQYPHLAILWFPLFLLWIVFVTNAFNIIDGLDGLAAGVALLSILAIAELTAANGDQSGLFMEVVLAGALVGFLRFNFNPASIFLGDGGSLFLGCMLSSLALQQVTRANFATASVIVPVLAFGVPVFETALSIVRRVLTGRGIFVPDREHVHHRLLRNGLRHRGAVLMLYGACLGFSLLSLSAIGSNWPIFILVLLLFGGGALFGVARLYPEFGEFVRLIKRSMAERKSIPANLALDDAARSLEKCRSQLEIVCVLDSLLQVGGFDSYAFEVTGAPRIRRRLVSGSICNIPEMHRNVLSTADGEAFFWNLGMTLEHKGMQVGRLSVGRDTRGSRQLMSVEILIEKFRPALLQACLCLHEHSDRTSMPIQEHNLFLDSLSQLN